MICSSSNRRAIFIGPSPARHSSKIYRTTFAAGSSIIHCFELSGDFIYPKGTAADTRSPFSAFDFQTAFIFFAICIVGNIINVIMEEGVFRGLFQQILQKKYSFVLSAVVASCLFGLWHMIAPLRNYDDGTSSMGGLIFNAALLVVTSGLIGFKFALLTKMTNNLYMAMGDHFVNNTIVNILHVVSKTGADELQFVRITVAQTLSFIIVLVYHLKNTATENRIKSKP